MILFVAEGALCDILGFEVAGAAPKVRHEDVLPRVGLTLLGLEAELGDHIGELYMGQAGADRGREVQSALGEERLHLPSHDQTVLTRTVCRQLHTFFYVQRPLQMRYATFSVKSRCLVMVSRYNKICLTNSNSTKSLHTVSVPLVS